MAKLHQAEMYILDNCDNYDTLEQIVSDINDRMVDVLHTFGIELIPFDVKSVEFEHHDDHILNFDVAKQSDYRGMFVDDSDNENLVSYLENLIDEIKKGKIKITNLKQTNETIQLKPENNWAMHYPTGNMEIEIKLKNNEIAKKWLNVSRVDIDG